MNFLHCVGVVAFVSGGVGLFLCICATLFLDRMSDRAMDILEIATLWCLGFCGGGMILAATIYHSTH